MNKSISKKFVVFVIFLTSCSTYWVITRERTLDSIRLSKREIDTNHLDFNQEDAQLVQLVREKFLIPPNARPLTLTGKTPSNEAVQNILLKLLGNNTKDGFFVEAGAHDGEYGGTSLYLEQYLDWSGLLIEPANGPFLKLKDTNRKAWISNVAVSSHPYVSTETFFENKNVDLWGGLQYRFYKNTELRSKVLCIPLSAYMLALNRDTINFLSLDIEGTELEVLQTIPFDKLTIEVISVEVNNGKGGPGPIRDIMKKNGYKLVANLRVPLSSEYEPEISPIITKKLVQSVYFVFSKLD